jgi:Bacterial Ig-like domain (group 1)/PKD domain
MASRNNRILRPGPVCAAIAVVSLMSFASACDKIPLLAPSGTVITLFPVSSTVALNSEVEIVGTVIEQGTATTPPPTNGDGNGTTPPPTNGNGSTSTPTTGAGTPVHNGTLVTFTTTLGRIEPVEARTSNGQVRVRFISGSQSGTATITAFSGGASGRLENLRVGTAAVERVIVTANPQTLGASGGTTEITARVEDAGGLVVAGVSVSFSTSSGQISPNPATTDQNGIARATLTTTREANVTATVAGQTSEQLTIGLNPRTGISITGPTSTVAAGQPVTFTINVNAQANIREVVVDYGDGTADTVGALSGSTTVSHVYQEAGTYRASAVARDASGFSEQVSTSVTVLPAQPPTVTLTATNSTPTIGELVQITASVSGATSSIIRYEWTFGPGADRPSQTTSSNRVSVTWSTVGTKIVTVRVIQASGPEGDNSIPITVRP